MPRPLFTPGNDSVPIVQEVGWAPGPVWTGAENLAPTGIRSPDRPARSQSLYRLRYPAHSDYCAIQYLILWRLEIPGVCFCRPLEDAWHGQRYFIDKRSGV